MKFKNANLVLNGLSGASLKRLLAADMDPGILRPYLHEGKAYVSLRNSAGEEEVHRVDNATATLPHEAWLMIDQTVTRAAQARLKAVNDLRSRGLEYGIPNGMSVPVLMTQRASRAGTAQVAMDPVQKGPNDRQDFDSVNLPLPVIFSDWSMSARDLAVSRRGGLPLDMACAEDGARAVAEEAEKLLIGNSDYNAYSYGGGTIYGYLNFPSRNTYTITSPTDSAWVGSTLLSETLAMKQALMTDHQYGPYVMYVGPSWAQYLDGDYNSTTSGQTNAITVRERILKVDGIESIQELDYLTGFNIILVKMQSDTVREVVGMDITTVQWETDGGLSLNFKTMAILVPHLRADYSAQCGICHGSV